MGWLGYGGNLTWRKQEYVVEYVFGVPISQGSLAKMQRWFQSSLEPDYQQWLSYVKQPGVRCDCETTYCIDGIKYWLWVATSDRRRTNPSSQKILIAICVSRYLLSKTNFSCTYVPLGYTSVYRIRDRIRYGILS